MAAALGEIPEDSAEDSAALEEVYQEEAAHQGDGNQQRTENRQQQTDFFLTSVI